MTSTVSQMMSKCFNIRGSAQILKASDALDQFAKFESCINNLRLFYYSLTNMDFERNIQKSARTPVEKTKYQRYSPLDQKEIRH